MSITTPCGLLKQPDKQKALRPGVSWIGWGVLSGQCSRQTSVVRHKELYILRKTCHGPRMMWTVPAALKLTEEQRRTLSSWVSARNTPQTIVFRVRIVLLAAEGKANNRIAQELGTSRPSVILWRRRFQEGGTATLSEDAPGRGRKGRRLHQARPLARRASTPSGES